MTETNIMTIEEAAKYLNVASASLKRICREGTGPKFFRISRTISFRKIDIDNWLERRINSTPPKRAKKVATQPTEKPRTRVQAVRG